MYQIIPRKYRPQAFSSIVGQEAIVITLKNAIRLQRLAHAYLFCGPKGTGKTTLARLFAKALNCKHLDNNEEPCNQCPSCLEITSGHSLDVLEIDGASNRGIDDIRQINETIGYAPASGKYKIYIIDEVHMLTKEAFNALLKTLEEPPAHVKFFFATTEPHKVLPTIISRCQRFDLSRISEEAMQQKLAWIAQDLKVEIGKDTLQLIIDRAEGSLRDAESLLDQVICSLPSPITFDAAANLLGITPRAFFLDLDQAIHQGNLSFAFELAEKIFASGKDLGYFMEALMEHFRHILKQTLQNKPSPYTQEHCLYILDFLIDWHQQMAKVPFKRIGLETALLHLIRSPHRLSIDTLVRRLVQLEKPQEKQVEKTEPLQAIEKKLVQVIKKAPEPPKTHPTPAKPPEPPPETPKPKETKQSKYDTLMRFAAVELEGIVKGR
jgi:DNA polymerase-3 subunit gamma/tau